MSDTPKTDALREVIVGQYKEDELTGNGMGNLLAALTDIETLEREWDAERALADLLAKALLSFCSSGMVWPNTDTPEKAIAAWKEARSE